MGVGGAVERLPGMPLGETNYMRSHGLSRVDEQTLRIEGEQRWRKKVTVSLT